MAVCVVVVLVVVVMGVGRRRSRDSNCDRALTGKTVWERKAVLPTIRQLAPASSASASLPLPSCPLDPACLPCLPLPPNVDLATVNGMRAAVLCQRFSSIPPCPLADVPSIVNQIQNPSPATSSPSPTTITILLPSVDLNALGPWRSLKLRGVGAALHTHAPVH